MTVVLMCKSNVLYYSYNLLLQIAVDSGCYKINWHVLDWNTSSHAFYKGIGAEVCREWHIYKLENTAMLEFVGKETDIVG